MADLKNPAVSEKEQKWFDAFRRYIIPALGVGEAIATRGTSPGTTAMNMEKNFQTQEDRRRQMMQEEEDRVAAALERTLKEKQAGIQEKVYNEQLSKAEQDREAERAALERAGKFRENLSEIQGKSYAEQPGFVGPPTIEEQGKQETVRNEDLVNALKQFVAAEYPKEYLQQTTQPDFYEKLAATFGSQRALEDIRQAPERQKEADKKAEEARKVEERKQTILSMVEDIKNDPGKFYGMSMGAIKKFAPGTLERNYSEKVKQLKNILTIDNLGVMKGALSNTDVEILARAATTLDTSLGEEGFNKELEKIKNRLSGKTQNTKNTKSTKNPLDLDL